jgi:Tol biopolymer transport system component
MEGGAPRPIPGVPAAARMMQFDPDGSSIDYLVSHEDDYELWSLPAKGGEARRLVRFEGKEISDFAWSPGGRWLAVVKNSRSGDVVLLKSTSTAH